MLQAAGYIQASSVIIRYDVICGDGDGIDSRRLSCTGDLDACRTIDVSRRASGIVVSGFFNFEGITVDGLLRRAFATSDGIERNLLASLPRELDEREE
jgi:hypothetical protein